MSVVQDEDHIVAEEGEHYENYAHAKGALFDHIALFSVPRRRHT